MQGVNKYGEKQGKTSTSAKFSARIFPYLFVLLWTFLSGTIALAQDSYFSVKFFGVSYHPYGDENAELMPLNPDGKGYAVLNVGGTVGYEISIGRSKYSVKVLQSLYADCAAQFGGFSHLGLRAVIFRKNKHLLSGGLGPTLIFWKLASIARV